MLQFNAIRLVFHQWDRASIFPGVTRCFDLDQTPGNPRENAADSARNEAQQRRARASATGYFDNTRAAVQRGAYALGIGYFSNARGWFIQPVARVSSGAARTLRTGCGHFFPMPGNRMGTSC